MMSTDHCPAPLLRIQPQFSHYAQWARLAQRESLFYEALELSMAPMLDGNAAAACREWYKSSGRVNAIHGAFIDVNPASGDPAFRELSRRRCRESCTLAVELGAEQVVFHSSAFPFLRGGYLENWADICAAFYMELAEEYRGLTLCIENSQDLDPEPLEALMKRTGDGVRVCLDIGHAHYSGTPLEAWFDVLGPSIACLHLSDNMGRFDDHLPIGDGGIDWAMADRLYQGLGKELPMTLEVGGLQGVDKSLAFLRRNGYFALEG